MKKCVFYGRYSSVMQNEQSIEGQLHVAEKYAAENGYDIIGHYIDRALSGTSDKRPEFQRMISDSSRGEFEAVLVYKLDRFARNRYDSAIYKKKLRDNGIRVISATETITDSPEGIIMEGILEAMDEYYSAELGRKMRRGKEESMKKGRFVNSACPYGYKVVDHRLAIDEEKAPVALEIFRRYADGETQKEIVDSLNSRGMVNSVGKPWNTMNLSHMFNSQVYLGTYRSGSLDADGTAPQFIPEDIYNKVIQRRQNYINAHRKTYSGYDYYLTGKLKCSCGAGMTGFCSHKGKYHYYRCREHCGIRNIIADDLHESVCDALKFYFTPDKVKELAEAAYQEYQKSAPVTNERETIEHELSGIEQKLQNAVNAVLNGINSKALKDTIEQLESRRDKLRLALNDLAPQPPKLTLEHFTFVLSRIVECTSVNGKKELINTVVDCVIVSPDQTVVCINLTDENNTPPLEQILLRRNIMPLTIIQSKIFFSCGWIYISA